MFNTLLFLFSLGGWPSLVGLFAVCGLSEDSADRGKGRERRKLCVLDTPAAIGEIKVFIDLLELESFVNCY